MKNNLHISNKILGGVNSLSKTIHIIKLKLLGFVPNKGNETFFVRKLYTV